MKRVLFDCLAWSFLGLSSLHAAPVLTISTQPTGSSAGLSLSANPTEQPPQIPYLAIRLAPGHADEANLVVKKVAASGRVLLALPEYYDPPGNATPVLGYRWNQGVLQPLYRPAYQQDPYATESPRGFSALTDMDGSGVVFGNFSHQDTFDYRWVTSDTTYVRTGAYWPAGLSVAQVLPAPTIPNPLLGGYRPTFVTESGIAYGRQLSRGRSPLHRESDYITPENGLHWASVTATPVRMGANWAGDVSIPESIRRVTAASSQGTHTLAQVDYRFYTYYGGRDYTRTRPIEYERDGVTLNVGAEPVAINEAGRWIFNRSVPSAGINMGPMAYWADDSQTLNPLTLGAASSINDAGDIFVTGYPSGVKSIWKWLPSENNDGYVYKKHSLALALPIGMSLVNVGGSLTNSGLLGGTVRQTIDSAGAAIPENQQINSPALFVPVEATWEAVATNANVSLNKTPAPTNLYGSEKPAGVWMPGGGYRIFPDRKFPADTTPRNLAVLSVKLSPSLMGRTLYARLFDVDDPLPWSFDRDAHDEKLVDINDVDREVGDDNYGPIPIAKFLPDEEQTSSALIGSDGVARFTLRVSNQPGDNYRVALSLDGLASLAALQVSDPSEPGYVSNQSERHVTDTGFVLSPMLTVWRKLHLEIDSMLPASTGAVANYVSGAIGATIDESMPGIVRLSTTSEFDDEARFERGRLLVNNVFHDVQDVQVNPAGGGVLVDIYKKPGFTYSTLAGQAFVLYDDDDSFRDAHDFLPNLSAENYGPSIVAAIKPKFIPAYIEVVDGNALNLNSEKLIPFSLNEDVVSILPNVFDDAINISNSSNFWTHALVFAFQPRKENDGDASVESLTYGKTLLGSVAFDGGGFSAIFLESVREEVISPNDYSNYIYAPSNFFHPDEVARREKKYKQWLFGTIAHEIGHGPESISESGDHSEGGIMTANGADLDSAEFSVYTIYRMRITDNWR